jgi:hypothetical protein
MPLPDTSPEQAPGHYGAGYGEQVPADAPPRPAPKTDADTASSTGVPADAGKDSTGASDSSRQADDSTTRQSDDSTPRQSDDGGTRQGDDGSPVVFTPEDVHARPPDHPPTENAPESEKAGLIFERS